MKKHRLIISVLFLAVFPLAALASDAASADGGEDILMAMARLVMQLGVIVMLARFAGLLYQKVKMPIPSVLVEVLIGVLIGPYLLGGFPLPGLPNGLFPITSGTGLPVSPELYGIASIASIIMLFCAGLETNLALLLKFSFVGLLVGFGGAVLAFTAGAGVASFFFGIPFFSPIALFLGAICASSSTGITVRILTEKRKMDSPEGVTILAGMAIDDVLSVIALTAVTGYIAATTMGGASGASTEPVLIITKAVLVWFGFTAAGILFAGPLSRAIKRFKTVTHISTFALSLAFILAGIFQMSGLAMIIGAYVVGLSLSKTDLTDTVNDALEVLHSFFVPVFFIVMGMLLDMRAIMSKEVLMFGAIYTFVAVAAKILGCGIPTLFMNFNRLGALRIGTGMAPRGEVAFIAAGVGLSSGIIDRSLFGAGVMMVLFADLLVSPILSALFRDDRKGTKKTFKVRDTVFTKIELASRELTGLLEGRIVRAFNSEGFYIHSVVIEGRNLYHLRKNETLITLHCLKTGLEFESDAQDVIFIKTTVHETLLQINDIIVNIKDLIKPESESLMKELTDATWRAEAEIKSALLPNSIAPSLKARTKLEVIEELIGVLCKAGIVKDDDSSEAINGIMEREASMSTGMQYGVALPHCRTDAVDKITVAVGISRKGIDYESIDGEPSTIFVLILSPKSSESSYLQFLANVSALLNSSEMRSKLLLCKTEGEVYHFFMIGLGN
ncbi:MAG: cation:proton antiporter [Chitinispirillales bacterium]|jgi:Kef-type K+ transport system membrane component KefB/mannitol/fructose-specific phosphotransferase system IIA component (Ntr-type)|nr:cation:proton antiporter [Chitinispirillales bacterium]